MARILIFNDTMEMGGTEKLLVDLLNHLVTKGDAVTLLLPELSIKNVLLKDLDTSIKIKYIHKNSKSGVKRKISENLMIFYPRIFAKLKKIRTSDYDLAICFKESFYARIFSKMSLPKILWIHNILYKRHYEIRSLKERVAVCLNKKQIKISQNSYDHYNIIVCVSEACRKAYIDVLHNGNTTNQDIRLIYNAVDLSKVVARSKEEIKPIPQDRINFILITRNSPEKRTDRLINAADRLKQEKCNFHVYLIGDINIQETELILKQRNLSDTISCLGKLDNPYPYILQSNWLLCVSERESFSLTLLEAMTLKTPVITTNCGGPTEIIDNGKYGILVENSGEGVYQGMKDVINQPSLSVKYSTDLDVAICRFDYAEWLKNIDDLLKI